MRRCTYYLSLCLLATVLGSDEGIAADAKPPKDAEKDAASKPDTYRVKRGVFKIEVAVDGVFEAQRMTEIALHPKQWSVLTVLKAVEHGTRVKQDHLLVELDLEKIDRAIADFRFEQQIADLSLKQAEQQLQLLESSTPLDLAASLRSQRVADEDLRRYREVDRPLLIKATHFALKTSQQYLEYQQEELRQLEKMYKADDLTEETEEIILKRARNAVERAKFNVERAKIDHEQALKIRLPRSDQAIADSTRRVVLQSDSDKVTLPLALKKARLELDKLKIEQTRSAKKLKRLLADREMMVVKAPADGVVYRGRCVRGKWSTSSSSGSLRRGSAIAPKETFMVILQPRPMFVRATLAEKHLQYVRPGVKGSSQPTGYPDMRLPTVTSDVAAVPLSSGGFDARFAVTLDRRAEALMPGMTCKLKLTAYLNRNAVTVPPKALATDELDDQKYYVMLVGKDGKPQKRYVTVGKRTDKKVEILKGLSQGDEILSKAEKEGD